MIIMNKVTLVGRLIKDPQIKYIGESQIPVVDFMLAVNRSYKDKEGIKKADFIRVEIWNRQAEVFCEHLQKGRLIAIEGSLRVDVIEDLEGKNKYFTKVKASKFEFLDYKKVNKSLALS